MMLRSNINLTLCFAQFRVSWQEGEMGEGAVMEMKQKVTIITAIGTIGRSFEETGRDERGPMI